MPYNSSSLIGFFVANGVPIDTVILILMLPITATFIAFFRQVVGIKAFGIYTPLIITVTFLAIDVATPGIKYAGIKYGVTIFIAVIVIGMIMRFVLKPFRLLYLPRVAIMITVVALMILWLLLIGGNLKRTGLASVSIFPILIMITIVEKFVSVQIEKGNKMAIILAGETLLISVVCYLIASTEILKQLIMQYPWVVLITIPINIALGKWTGLRLTEYYRFRDVIKKM